MRRVCARAGYILRWPSNARLVNYAADGGRKTSRLYIVDESHGRLYFYF